jgi:hypothetical protein
MTLICLCGYAHEHTRSWSPSRASVPAVGPAGARGEARGGTGTPRPATRAGRARLGQACCPRPPGGERRRDQRERHRRPPSGGLSCLGLRRFSGQAVINGWERGRFGQGWRTLFAPPAGLGLDRFCSATTLAWPGRKEALYLTRSAPQRGCMRGLRPLHAEAVAWPPRRGGWHASATLYQRCRDTQPIAALTGSTLSSVHASAPRHTAESRQGLAAPHEAGATRAAR